jgi:hypothetical protein
MVGIGIFISAAGRRFRVDAPPSHQRHSSPPDRRGFTIPDPLLTKELNIPNVCNRCHADKSTDWGVKYTAKWYGTNMNRFSRERTRWTASI